jgi:hypothetical protein
MDRQIDCPKPTPLVFVVKKGSKTSVIVIDRQRDA